MKKLPVFLPIFAMFFLISCSGNGQTADSEMAEQINVVQVIDFHSTNRCITCKAIEKKSLDTLTKNFKEELENGTITFQTINVDDDVKYALAEEFQATGTALFINIIVNNESNKIDLTEFAFMRAKIEDNSFENRLTREVSKGLKKIGYGVAN